MAKKKSKKLATFAALLAVVMGALAACTIFMPYLSSKITSLLGNSESTTISGLEFIKCLFEGNKLESVFTGSGNVLIKMLMGSKELSAATYTIEIGAIVALGFGALMVVFGLLYLFSKSALMKKLTMFSSFMTFVGGLCAMIAAIVIGKKLSVDAGIVGTLVSVSYGSIIALCAGFIGLIGVAVVKK